MARLFGAITAGEVSSYTSFGLCLEWGSLAIVVWLLRQRSTAVAA